MRDGKYLDTFLLLYSLQEARRKPIQTAQTWEDRKAQTHSYNIGDFSLLLNYNFFNSFLFQYFCPLNYLFYFSSALSSVRIGDLDTIGAGGRAGYLV